MFKEDYEALGEFPCQQPVTLVDRYALCQLVER